MSEQNNFISEEAARAIVNEAVTSAVRQTLLSLGLDSNDPLETQRHMNAMREIAEIMNDPEYQADQLHLRRWRKSMDQASNVTVKTAVGIIVTGFFGMVVYAIQQGFGR